MPWLPSSQPPGPRGAGKASEGPVWSIGRQYTPPTQPGTQLRVKTNPAGQTKQIQKLTNPAQTRCWQLTGGERQKGVRGLGDHNREASEGDPSSAVRCTEAWPPTRKKVNKVGLNAVQWSAVVGKVRHEIEREVHFLKNAVYSCVKCSSVQCRIKWRRWSADTDTGHWTPLCKKQGQASLDTWHQTPDSGGQTADKTPDTRFVTSDARQDTRQQTVDHIPDTRHQIKI